jgi:CRP-like cAMP-binding protein
MQVKFVDKREILKEVFKDLGEEVLEEMARRVKVKHTQKKEYLFFEGEEAEGVYIVAQGLVKLTKETLEGEELVVDYLSKGDIFGWIGGSSFHSAISVLPSIILYMPARSLRELALKSPGLCLTIVGHISKRLKRLYEHLELLAAGKVENRIADFLLRLADKIGRETPEGYIVIEAPITRNDIAKTVGTTIETTIRVMSRWKKEGIIDSERGKIVLKDLDRLENLSYRSYL